MKKLHLLWLFVSLISLISASCQDVKDYRGTWRGNVKQSRLVRKGLDICSVIVLDINEVSSSSLNASIRFEVNPEIPACSAALPDEGPVLIDLPSESFPLTPSKEYLNDEMSEMNFQEDTFFTHLAWVNTPTGSFGILISFFRGPKISVRILSPDIFGVFHLKKE